MQITIVTVAPHFHLSFSDADTPRLCFDLARLERGLAWTP